MLLNVFVVFVELQSSKKEEETKIRNVFSVMLSQCLPTNSRNMTNILVLSHILQLSSIQDIPFNPPKY